MDGLLVHRVTIEERSVASDGMLGTAETWTTKYSNVHARIQPLSATEQVKHGSIGVPATDKMYIKVSNRTVTEKDRVNFNGVTYRVVGSRNIDELGRFFTIDLERIK